MPLRRTRNSQYRVGHDRHRASKHCTARPCAKRRGAARSRRSAPRASRRPLIPVAHSGGAYLRVSHAPLRDVISSGDGDVTQGIRGELASAVALLLPCRPHPRRSRAGGADRAVRPAWSARDRLDECRYSARRDLLSFPLPRYRHRGTVGSQQGSGLSCSGAGGPSLVADGCALQIRAPCRIPLQMWAPSPEWATPWGNHQVELYGPEHLLDAE